MIELQLLLHLHHPVDQQQAHLFVYGRLLLDVVSDLEALITCAIIFEDRLRIVGTVEFVQFGVNVLVGQQVFFFFGLCGDCGCG